MTTFLYEKRRGTSGACGQLYETKLLSLILFRALHDDDIEEIYIGTNVDGLGEFDDICLRFKVKGFDKPVAVFLQAKHRDDQNRPLKVTKKDLMEYFKSYMNVRNKFNVNSSDALFRGAYDDVECAFVFYTNTKDELDKEYQESEYISKINDVISTGDDAFQLSYTENDVKLLNEMVLHAIIEQLALLIADIVRVKGENYKSLMNNELMQTYHVILSQRVFIIKDLKPDYCEAQINKNIFDATDEYLNLLGKGLVEALKGKKLGPKTTLNCSPQPPSPTESSSHTGSEASDNNKLQYDDEHLKEELEEKRKAAYYTTESMPASAEAEYWSASFKLPAEFGNRDLTLRGQSPKKGNRLCHLANVIVNLLKNSNSNNVNDDTFNIVSIDDTFPDKGFLRLNGGIAGAVGNLLIFDNKTRLLMFQDGNRLTGHAKTLLDKIKNEVKELEKYRLDVRVKNFPKLSFDCNEHDKSMVADFTNRLLFCTNQARESEVEQILKGDIGRLQNTRDRCNFQIKSDAIFLAYHDEIQKWWLKKKKAEYLTKTSPVFKNSIERFIRNPLLSVANVLSKNKIMKHDITFDAEVVNSLELDESFSKITIIVSEVIALSVVKVTQYIKNKDYILIDLNYMLSLPATDCGRLHEELTNVEDKIFILTYRLSQVSKLDKDIKYTLQILKRKKLIVVTNDESLSKIRMLLSRTDSFIINDTSSLLDLTKESHETIIKNTNVIFQGEHVKPSLLVDADVVVFIKGDLLDKIMSGEVIQIGGPLTTSRYEEIKHFYVNRRVTLKRFLDPERVFNRLQFNEINLDTFYDVDEHTVLITAEPGMGKSSLLTHLSLATKARDPGVWIVRIDLLDYSRFFHQWTEDKAVIDIVEALRFICIALFKLNVNEKLIANESNGIVFLKDFCKDTDTEIIFQINMFLHHCSRRKVIFAFDGFDEICPHYEPQVIQFLKVLHQYRPREHRIWITSRTYSKILQSLESIFVSGLELELEPFDSEERKQFVERYFKLKLDLNALNEKQIEKIDNFISFMAQLNNFSDLFKCRSMPLHTVYLDAVQYFKDEIKHVPFLQDKEKYVKAWDINVQARRIMRTYNGNWTDVSQMKKFIAMPLHMYMVADYFRYQIKHVKTDTVWDLNLNTYAMYEQFVETKFRKIRFEEKNQVNTYKPDNTFTFEIAKKRFINEHKKLAAYVMFYREVDQLFSETELEEIRETVSSINIGQEKTGVICTVINGVPKFVHQTFAEYFAVEYISDKLKTEQSDDELKSLWKFILKTVSLDVRTVNMGILNVLDDKLFMDEEFKNKVSDARSRRIIFDITMARSNRAMMYGSLHDVVSENLPNLASLYLSTLEFITSDNVQYFVEVIAKSRAILEAVRLNNMEITNVVLDTVRRADASQIRVLFRELPGWDMECDNNTTNEEIVDYVRTFIPSRSEQ